MSNDSSNTSPDSEQAVSGQSQVPWKTWVGLLFVIVIFYASQVLAGLLLYLYPFLSRWSHAQTLDWLNNSVAAQFIFVALVEAIIIGAIYLFLRRFKLGFSSIGLKHPRLSDLGYGIAAVLPYFLLYFLTVGVVSQLIPSLNVDQEQQIGFSNVHGFGPLLMTFISLVILPPITEEILVRGFLYSTLKKALPTIGAVIITSLIFASAHLPEGGAAGPLYIAALDTFVLSLVLIYLREKTGSLWASITLHAIKNGIAFVALFIVQAH